MRGIQRSEEEIDEVLNLAAELNNEGKTKYFGQTYEQGVEDALLWVFGDSDDNPLKEG